MGVGKLAADVAGGIVTKKAMDKVLDNEGEDKSFVKSAAGVGAGLVAAKVIDDTIDKRKEAKEQEGEKQGLGFVKSAALGAGAGFAATTLLHNKDDIKKMTQQDVKDTSMLERANPFAQQQPQLETGINQQFRYDEGAILLHRKHPPHDRQHFSVGSLRILAVAEFVSLLQFKRRRRLSSELLSVLLYGIAGHLCFLLIQMLFVIEKQ